MEQSIQVRCRGVVSHGDKILVVKHSKESTFFAFPGGHLEWGESPIQCIKREMVEELGLEPKIGRLLYVNTFTESKGKHNIEFFYEIQNGEDYLDLTKNIRSHAHEIYEIKWIDKNHDLRLLPALINEDFKQGRIFSDTVRQIESK